MGVQWAQFTFLWLSCPSLMRGYQDVFQCVVIFVRCFADGNFCEVLVVAGGFILFSLHMTMVWDLANGAGIPAPSNATQTSISVDRRGWGFQLHRRAKVEDLDHRADERKLLFV